MYAALITIHVIASIFLIAVILLQAGRGGGLADSFGGSQMQSLFGTKSTSVLTRLTTICAATFMLTCLTLAIVSSYRSKSLMEKVNIPVSAAPVEIDTSVADVEGKKPATSLPVDIPGEIDTSGDEE